jgi:hypothetical protein
MKKVENTNFTLDITERIFESIKSSKVLNYSKIVVIITAGVLAIGYGAKILNFSISNVKVLAKTIKNNPLGVII